MKQLITYILLTFSIFAQAQPKEIIYGHKDGLALTMLLYKPTIKANNKAVINIISSNWKSSYTDAVQRKSEADIYTKSGYTVFNVMHGSQPRYNITEAVQDVKRAVRFIRFNAKIYNIKPNSIGIVGGSSGGHLALLVATTGADSAAIVTDVVDKVSDRVKAVGAFYPPTDLLNYGFTGYAPATDTALLTNYGVAAAFDFKIWDDDKQLYNYATIQERLNTSKTISPIYAISADDPPAYLIHGDKDEVVPLQQSAIFVAAYKKINLPVSFFIKKGEGHGWKHSNLEEEMIVKWFDKYLP